MISNPTKGFFPVTKLLQYYVVGIYLDTYPDCHIFYLGTNTVIQKEAADSELLKALYGR